MLALLEVLASLKCHAPTSYTCASLRLYLALFLYFSCFNEIFKSANSARVIVGIFLFYIERCRNYCIQN